MEDSNFYLNEDAVFDSCVSRLQLSKQMLNDEEEDEWMMCFSSTMLRFEENSKCHVKVQGSIAAILQESSHFCFNRSSTMPVEDEYTKNNAKAMQQLIKRSWKNLREFERIEMIFDFGSEIVIVDSEILLQLGIYTPC